jgi:RNA polymerase sigma factor (sigma-70 family)
MADTQLLGAAIQKALQQFSTERHAGVSDSQLLQRFATHRDEVAFETLVWRHGPMVLATCRRILHHAQDAEDAFQAAFLVLSRKARSIRKRTSCGAWLHKVAYHIAVRARAAAARRGTTEKLMPTTLAARPADDLLWRDLRPVLDEELDRLPPNSRSVLVLHYLEGKTIAQVAADLGWRPGTVSGRLARAKDLLRSRLTRRGLGLAGTGVMTGVLGQEASAASLLVRFVQTAVAAATARGATATACALTSTAINLGNGTLRTMMLTKLKTAALLLLVATVVALGVGVLADKVNSSPPTAAAEPPKPPDDTQPKPAENRFPDRRPRDGWPPGTKFAQLQASPFWVPLMDSKEMVRTTDSVRDGNFLRTLLYSPDGRRMTFVEWKKDPSIGWQSNWRIHEAATGKEIAGLGGNPHCMMYSPDGKLLAGSAHSGIRFRDAATGQELQTLTVTVPKERDDPDSLLEASIDCFTFSPDGKKIAAVSSAMNPLSAHSDIDPESLTPIFTLWETATGKQLQQVRGKNGRSYSLRGFSSEEIAQKALRAGVHHWGGAVVLESKWGDQLQRPGGGSLKAHSPDGKIYATPAAEGVHLCVAETREVLRVLTKHEHPVTTLAFSPDGRYLASGDEDGHVYLWVTATGKLRWEVLNTRDRDIFKGYEQEPGRRGWISSVFFSPDGTKLVTVGDSRAKDGGYGIHVTYLWNLTEPAVVGHPASLSVNDLEGLWADLAAADSGTAYGAIVTLVAAPDQAATLLGAKTRSLSAPHERVARLLAELDDDEFEVREKASAELAKLGELVRPFLRQALQQQSSAEVRQRLEKILEQKLSGDDAAFGREFMRGARVVDVLETIATPEARAMLQRLAKGSPKTLLTREAETALMRLGKE